VRFQVPGDSPGRPGPPIPGVGQREVARSSGPLSEYGRPLTPSVPGPSRSSGGSLHGVVRLSWHEGAKTASAFVFGVCWFALSAVVLHALPGSHPMVATLVGVAVNVVVVVAVAHYGGIGDAVTVGVAGVVALDWYTIPPVHPHLVPDVQNALALVAYLVTGTLLGQLAVAARRRAELSEQAASLLADEQAALRRVATLVAQEAAPEEVFASITSEVGRLLSIDLAALLRYESDGTATVMAAWTPSARGVEVGFRADLAGDSVASSVLRTGKPARMNSYDEAHGAFATALRELGVRSSAGSPIIVAGRTWGVMVGASLTSNPIPEATEQRLDEFTELAGTAVANAEARGELTASRARIVASGDEARRRIERDLHDGVQQRLVSLALDASRIERLGADERGSVTGEVARLREGLVEAADDLRELSHGIHPAILSEGGLRPALAALARRSPLPVQLDIGVPGRLPEPVEVCVYFVVSESLTNAFKHARATSVEVCVEADDHVVRLDVRDDGIGGVDARRGSGLVGLSDRVHALGGSLDVSSRTGAGTSLAVQIPHAAGIGFSPHELGGDDSSIR
jgi:signal transduction histidine kinase